MNELFELIYHADDPLYTLVSLCIVVFAFEFVLCFAYVLRSAKNGVNI